MKKTKKGFTLVELLVVIAILSILVTITVIGYTGFVNNAKNVAAETELNTIITYINAELADDGKLGNIEKEDITTTSLKAALEEIGDFEGEIAVDNKGDVITITYTLDGITKSEQIK